MAMTMRCATSALGRSLEQQSWRFLRRSSKCVSACQSQHQPVRQYGHHQHQMKLGADSTTANAIIHPHHVVGSGVPQVHIPNAMLHEYIWNDVDKWSTKIAMVRLNYIVYILPPRLHSPFLMFNSPLACCVE